VPGILFTLRPFAPILVVVPTPAEARVIGERAAISLERNTGPWRTSRLDEFSDLVICGVGKVNAAGAVAALGQRYKGVLNLGIAGSLPGSGLSTAAAVLGSPSAYADEGLLTPQGYVPCHDMGFPLGSFESGRIMPDPEWAGLLRPLVDAAGPIATVSTCSGTDQAAAEVVRRTGALCEGMEGAAVGHAAARLGIRFAEVRVISNNTGDRDRQRWDLGSAAGRIANLLGL
jgi:futalosine hydrolase